MTSERASVLVDWLSGTYPDGTAPTEVLPGAAGLGWVELPHGGYHYPHAIALGHIRTYYGGEPGQGVHSVMGGQGCREAEGMGLVGDPSDCAAHGSVERYGKYQASATTLSDASQSDWSALSRWTTARGFKARRLDLAADDRSGVLDLETIRRAWDDGAVTSTWATMDERRPRHKGGEKTGHGLYFGKPGSGTRLRIYDKALEQGDTSGRPWVRVELQLTGEAAERVWRLIGEREPASIGQLVRELILGRLKFRDPTRSRIERCPIAAWWLAFLGDVAGRRIGSDPKLATIEDIDRWLDHGVMPMLALSVEASGGDLTGLIARLRAGRKRWAPRHLAILTAAA